MDASDIKFRKARINNDSGANGGLKGRELVIAGAVNGLIPRVLSSDRITGKTRYRKEFFCNENTIAETAANVYLFLEFTTAGGDNVGIIKGTPDDVQAAMTADMPALLGVGVLNTTIAASATSVDLMMETDDFTFPNGAYMAISNRVMTGQTLTGISVGSSVEYSGGSWGLISPTNDIIYPRGRNIGDGRVYSILTGSNTDLVQVAENLYTNEPIALGDGVSLTPSLGDLNNDPITDIQGLCPVITAEYSGGLMTVYVAPDGTCSGDCIAGLFNFATGEFDQDITWTSPPGDNGLIAGTYHKQAYQYAGNLVSVDITPTANGFDADVTHGAVCLHAAEIEPTKTDTDSVSSAGVCDFGVITLDNLGTVEEIWTATFVSATSYTLSGQYLAADGTPDVGTGSVGTDFAPTNPDTGTPYLTLPVVMFSGTFAIGDTFSMRTHAADLPFWIRNDIPAGTGALKRNYTRLRAIFE